MAHGTLVVSELLCYLMRKYGITPNDSLKTLIGTFYSEEEISTAKDLLFATAMELKVDDLPNKVRRRNVAGKKKLEIDDIFVMIDSLDEKQLLLKLPKFVADDLARIPPFNTDDLDVCRLAIRLSELENKVANFLRGTATTQKDGVKKTTLVEKGVIHKSEVTDTNEANEAGALELSAPRSVGEPMLKDRPDKEEPRGDTIEPPRASYADIAANLGDENEGWTNSRQKRGKKKEKVRGSSDKISNFVAAKEIIKKTIYHLDNIAEGTLAEDVTEHLKNIGVPVISCFDCKSFRNQGKTEARAFRLCIDKQFSKAVLNGENWPKDVIVRPWRFKPQEQSVMKDSTSSSN